MSSFITGQGSPSLVVSPHSMKLGLGYSSFRAAVPSALQTFLETWMELMEEELYVSLGNVLPTADIAQFKQGVKSVAGKMAVLANGVMNSLQVRLRCWTWEKVCLLLYLIC